jgi:DNA-binding CsgD family transcriptional regulator
MASVVNRVGTVMVAQALHALGALFQWIQTDSKNTSVSQFRHDGLEQLCKYVRFDRAIWANAVISDRLSLRSAEFCNVTSEERADFELAASADPRLALVLQTPGTAHAYSVSPNDPAHYRALTEMINVAHVLSIAHFDTILSVASGLTLCRSANAKPFAEPDRAFVEVAFPHLLAGWTNCQLAELAQSSGPVGSSASYRDSALNAAEPGFLALMCEEWPNWTGPYLPTELTDFASGDIKPSYMGRFVVVRARLAVDTTLVTVRRRNAVDALTARERRVAELCAQGMTYKEISAALDLAPATARNHIAAVHKRLAVTRNGEIASLLAIAP